MLNTRALREIQPGGAEHLAFEALVFGPTGETLASRVRDAARATGLGDGDIAT